MSRATVIAATGWGAMLLATLLATNEMASVELDRASERDAAALVEAGNQFAFDLYARVRETPGNVFLSSYSVSSALAMTYGGARGETAAQMAKVLRLPQAGDRVHEGFARLTRQLQSPGTPGRTELSVANAIWPQTGYPLAAEFQALVRDRYGAALSPLDFQRAPETARATINSWVERQTRDRIKEVISEGALTRETRLVITNAIYFHGRWREPFQDASTEKAVFTLASGASVSGVPLMRQTGRFRYFDAGQLQVLGLPYEKDEQSMIVFLPKRADGLPALEKSLTAARVKEWIEQLAPHEVNVALPRFTITSSYQLRDPLSELGMPLPFSARADFSGITKAASLAVSQVFHKAYVQVNEKGTEAAAATGLTIVPLSMSRLPSVDFRADRPFFFVIIDHRNDALLFAGRLVNPAGS